jgi:hypothetical protein
MEINAPQRRKGRRERKEILLMKTIKRFAYMHLGGEFIFLKSNG